MGWDGSRRVRGRVCGGVGRADEAGDELPTLSLDIQVRESSPRRAASSWSTPRLGLRDGVFVKRKRPPVSVALVMCLQADSWTGQRVWAFPHALRNRRGDIYYKHSVCAPIYSVLDRLNTMCSLWEASTRLGAHDHARDGDDHQKLTEDTWPKSSGAFLTTPLRHT